MKSRNILLLILQILLFHPWSISSQTYIIGYSDLFLFGPQQYEYPNIIGYSGVFEVNNMGQYYTGYSGLFALNTIGAQVTADFSASNTSAQINQPIQFSNLSTGMQNPVSWTWNFGEGASPATANTQGPHSVTYNSIGNKTVSLTVINSAGVPHTTTKTNYITVHSQNNGISLRIVKTNPTSGPNVAKVGYYYSAESSILPGVPPIPLTVLNNNFILNQAGEVQINQFPSQADMPAFTNLKNAFNNEIILFDQYNNQVGHIPFEYIPAEENNYKREAILLLHNDAAICQGSEFPYSNQSGEYEKRWKYFKIGEYPVSMLIPPNNAFQANYTKIPLLLIHGWEGSYELIRNPDAQAGKNETSYWLTIVKKLNELSSAFDAWQYYYPYNSAHKHLAICLKSAFEHLKTEYISQKIRLTTHSMGGLVTLRYLTQYPDHARANVEKVLFMAPPAHGSLGANLYYKTTGSPILQWLIGYDRYAPSVRDMKLGSDATWFIHNNPLPDLGNETGVGDDYFVMLGTTYKFYKSDLYFHQYEKTGSGSTHTCLHPEASNHHDGIVSISSGSLLDKGVGFATFHGNHNDAVHMQSFKREDKNNQNIGESELLPGIINQYFTNSFQDFTDLISNNQYITTIVNTDRTIKKPAGLSWNNLNTGNGVNYKKGILNIDFAQKPSPNTYQASYSESSGILRLFPKFISGNFLFKGVFKSNTSSLNKKRYYFNDDNTVFKEDATGNKAITYNGCAIDLKQGLNSIYIYNNWGRIVARTTVNFRYCETNNVTINNSNKMYEGTGDNYTDTKEKYIANEGISLPDSLLTSFYIDDQTTLVDFEVSSLESVIQPFPVKLRMKLPDGTLADSTFTGATYQHDYELGSISMEIPDPMPGKWHVWLESENQEAVINKYSAVAFFQSEILSYLPDTTEVIAANVLYNLRAGLKVNDFNSSGEINVIATVNKPDGEKEIFNITSSAIMQDSSYLFNLNYNFNLPGEYLVKYNIDGVYNNYNFERCLYRSIEAVDTIPVLNIPDFSIRQFESQKVLDLIEYTYNIDNYDTLYFSSEILSINIDSTAFSASLDSLALYTYINTSLSDTGTVVMRFNCHFDEDIVSDTVVIKILMPELSVTNSYISDSIINNSSNICLNYTLANSGNYHSSEYEVKYYVTQDSLLQQTDYCLGSKTILQHAVDSLITINDTLQIPMLDLVGSYKLLVVLDAGNQVVEMDKSNNQAFLDIQMNPPPFQPLIITVMPDDGSVHLTWTSNHQRDISGYIIHYGTDSTWSLNQIYPLNNDTTYTVTGLTNNTVYYFSLSAYKIMGVNSERTDFVTATPIKNIKLQLTLFFEGLFNQALNIMNKAQNEYGPAFPDSISDAYKLELHDAANTDSIVFISNNRVSINGISEFDVPGRFSGSYYLVVKHRNSIETWSAQPISFAADMISYDFTNEMAKAFGNNMKLIGNKYTIYGGDVNQDGAIDTADMTPVDNDAAGFVSGYLATDVNGDGIVDTADMTILDNNSFGFVGSITP